MVILRQVFELLPERIRRSSLNISRFPEPVGPLSGASTGLAEPSVIRHACIGQAFIALWGIP